MVNRVQTLRSSAQGSRPTGRSPGELFVNFPDNALGVVNAAGTAVDLVAVRFFSTLANYIIGDYVIQAGNLYRAIAASAPAAFNAANWSKVMAQADLTAAYLPLAGGTLTGSLSVNPAAGGAFVSLTPAAAAQQAMVIYSGPGGAKWQAGKQTDDSFLIYDAITPGNVIAIASNGTTVNFSRQIILPANPSAALGAATKQYVDTADAGKVNDTGDTMTGPLVLPAGSNAATSLNFGTAGTGIYGGSATQFNLAAGGVFALAVSSGAVASLVPMRASDGVVSAPGLAFQSETNSGLWRAAASDVRLTIAGVDKFNFGAAAHTSAVPINVPVTPSANAHAASKQYVDGKVAAGVGSVVVRPFTASGPYNPTTGMLYCIIECVGGGGGSGGIGNSSGFGSGGPGGGGEYAFKLASATDIGVSKSVTVGAGGNAGLSGNSDGGNGTASSVGTLCIANGGLLGQGSAANLAGAGGAGGSGGTGDYKVAGAAGQTGGNGSASGVSTRTASGGSSGKAFGAGAPGSGAGFPGQLYGGGAGGATSVGSNGASAGQLGANGVVIITEFIKVP